MSRLMRYAHQPHETSGLQGALSSVLHVDAGLVYPLASPGMPCMEIRQDTRLLGTCQTAGYGEEKDIAHCA